MLLFCFSDVADFVLPTGVVLDFVLSNCFSREITLAKTHKPVYHKVQRSAAASLVQIFLKPRVNP